MKKLAYYLSLSFAVIFSGIPGALTDDKLSESHKEINLSLKLLPIKSFVADQKLDHMQISPNGKMVTYTLIQDEKQYLLVGELVNETLKVKHLLFQTQDLKKGFISNPQWVNDNRLIFTLNFQTKISGTKYKVWGKLLYGVDRDGANIIQLRTDGTKEGKRLKHFDAADLIHILPKEPDHILVGKSRNRSWLQNYYKGEISDVYKMNIITGEIELNMRAPKISGVKLNDWYSDRDGNIRFGYGVDRKGNSVMVIRGKHDEDWKKLSENELFEEGKFSPLQFGSQPNEFYVLSAMATGRNAIFKFNIATGELDGKIFEHDKVDVLNLIYSHEKQKILAAVYYDYKREMVFFDDDYKRMRISIEKALGMDVSIQSESLDEKNIILLTKADNYYGSYYHYDVVNKKINFLGDLMAEIYPEDIARSTEIIFETRDGITISGYITTPLDYAGAPLPTIVLPHENPHMRDYKEWNYMAKYLANRGYIVIQPNYRGSTGYGYRFKSLGYGEWGGDMQNDLTDATRWAIKEGYADPDKICIMGKSYAGYAALMGMATEPDLYKCAISWGGVSDIKRMFKDDKALDTDSSYYQRVAGDSKKSDLSKISPINYVKDIKGAILLVHGEEDKYHKLKQSSELARALGKAGKTFDFFEIKEAGHYLNTPEYKQQYLEIVENFLLEFNPTRALLKLKKDKKIAKKPKMTQSNR